MTEQRKTNRISSGVAATVATAAVAVAGITGYFTLNNGGDVNQPNPNITTSPNPQGSGTPSATSEKTATVYWLESSGTSFNLVPQGIQVEADVNNPSEFLEAAFNTLLAGPTEGTGSSAIPTGTKLLGIKANGDEVRVDLSDDFQFGGGSASMIGRVGQVVYTATALNPKAKVYLELNGETVEVLGGEGLELEQPLTRENFIKNFEL
ncbi:MAG: GerMN domain-containing protein [Rivularia sp. (in: Bacteria)]|nr:GerMN domain-containing protein [Rivularia sp. MS3]